MAIKIKRKYNILSADFPEGGVIFDLKTRLPYIFNPLAKEVWSLLAQPREKQKLVGFIVKKYAVSKRRLELDLTALLAKLEKKGLVEYVVQNKKHFYADDHRLETDVLFTSDVYKSTKANRAFRAIKAKRQQDYKRPQGYKRHNP